MSQMIKPENRITSAFRSNRDDKGIFPKLLLLYFFMLQESNFCSWRFKQFKYVTKCRKLRNIMQSVKWTSINSDVSGQRSTFPVKC